MLNDTSSRKLKKKMGAAHSITIPWEPYKVHKVQGKPARVEFAAGAYLIKFFFIRGRCKASSTEKCESLCNHQEVA